VGEKSGSCFAVSVDLVSSTIALGAECKGRDGDPWKWGASAARFRLRAVGDRESREGEAQRCAGIQYNVHLLSLLAAGHMLVCQTRIRLRASCFAGLIHRCACLVHAGEAVAHVLFEQTLIRRVPAAERGPVLRNIWRSTSARATHA
jgi:hypothetical protein